MADILAIVSRAIFEKDARKNGKLLGLGDVWPLDRYNSSTKALERLKQAPSGRIFLVTVRPDEELWLVGVIEKPSFSGTSWVSPKKNDHPITDVSRLRKTIRFESGKGMSQDKGTLGMSLQTPRALTQADVAQILAVAGGHTPPEPVAIAPPSKARIIDGKYEIVRQLGVGGMGVVYEARHTGTGRRVAVKEILGDEVQHNEQLVERFHREARATGAIETQHIALVLDSGTDAATSHPYLVMEFLQGEDLQHLLARTGPLPEEVALRIVAQACTGLVRAHEAGVVHRDIKPANLFLARRDAGEIVVKVLDFGIARMKEVAAPENRALTTTGLLLGSPLYMSPEQVLRPKDVDARTDSLVARRRPLRGAHGKDSVRRHARDRRRALRVDLQQARAFRARRRPVDSRGRRGDREEGALDRRDGPLRERGGLCRGHQEGARRELPPRRDDARERRRGTGRADRSARGDRDANALVGRGWPGAWPAPGPATLGERKTGIFRAAHALHFDADS